MTFKLGDNVEVAGGKTGRIVELANLFGQSYADVFIQPAGPLRRVPLTDLRPLPDPLVALSGGQAVPPPLFVARLAAFQLQALLTQQGVLSAANFRVTPLPHQVLAVDFVLSQLRPRALIADEVGLGKTIEAAMIYEELKLRRQARRALVVVPAGLTHQWRDELAQKFGETFVVYDRTMVAALREIHGQEANIWTLHDQVITSLDFVKPRRLRPDLPDRELRRRDEQNQRLFHHMVEAGWDVVIFDEAHKLSKHLDGTETARYQVGEATSKAVPVLLLLTATPHQGDAARFLHLLNLVDPYGFTHTGDLRPDRVSSVVWRTRKRAAVDGQGQRLFKQRITDIYPVDRSGPEHRLERDLYDQVTAYVQESYDRAIRHNDRAYSFLMILFQRMVASSTQAIAAALENRLRRLQALHSAMDRPGNNGDFDEEAAIDDDAQALLEELIGVSGIVDEAELVAEIAIVDRLLALARRAQATHDVKMVALLNIVDQVCRREGNPSTKFLIFTEFVATQRAIRQTLEGLGYTVAVIHGSQGLDERTAARQHFAGEAQFLVSTDAGGEGINLQFCHVMVNYDLPWNPMKLEQRIGRLDRIGQERDVLVLNLLVQDTVERRVREVLEEKLALIRQQYGEDKLADILSTLQDEFNFDRLYMDALRLREAQAAMLEQLGQQIYERAQQVIEQNDLLLPQAQTSVERYRERLAQGTQDRIQAMLSGYLAAQGEALNEYARRPGVYYFDLPADKDTSGPRDGGDTGKTRYAHVVFDRERAVADDGLDFIHLNHPVVQRVMAQLSAVTDAAIARLRIRPGPLPLSIPEPQGPALWGIYALRMTNHADVDRFELLSAVVDITGKSHPRLAQALLALTPEQVEPASPAMDGQEMAGLVGKVRSVAERQAHDLFSETQLAHAEQLATERAKIERYYEQQELAVRQIAIDNIRQAKQRELLERRREDLLALERRQTLVPQLTLLLCASILLVTFR